MITSNQTYQYVEIDFKDKQFNEAPAIIVTPLFNNASTAYPFQKLKVNELYLEKKSFTSVEYVTTKKALIKVGIIDTFGLRTQEEGAKLFESIPFSFIVVGPSYKLIVLDD